MTGELPVSLVAVICQLRAITRFALVHDFHPARHPLRHARLLAGT